MGALPTVEIPDYVKFHLSQDENYQAVAEDLFRERAKQVLGLPTEDVALPSAPAEDVQSAGADTFATGGDDPDCPPGGPPPVTDCDYGAEDYAKVAMTCKIPKCWDGLKRWEWPGIGMGDVPPHSSLVQFKMKGLPSAKSGGSGAELLGMPRAAGEWTGSSDCVCIAPQASAHGSAEAPDYDPDGSMTVPNRPGSDWKCFDKIKQFCTVDTDFEPPADDTAPAVGTSRGHVTRVRSGCLVAHAEVTTGGPHSMMTFFLHRSIANNDATVNLNIHAPQQDVYP